MISCARLSSQDAFDLLKNDAVWAIDLICLLLEDSNSNQLLAALLPRLGRKKTAPIELIIRVLPYERDPVILKVYAIILVESRRDEGYKLVSKLFSEGYITAKENREMMLNSPQRTIENGSTIDTPIGLVVVKYIERKDGTRLHTALLSDESILVHLEITGDTHPERLLYDVSRELFQFPEHKMIWKCGNCDFVHPQDRVLDQHHRDKHRQSHQMMNKGECPIHS